VKGRGKGEDLARWRFVVIIVVAKIATVLAKEHTKREPKKLKKKTSKVVMQYRYLLIYIG